MSVAAARSDRVDEPYRGRHATLATLHGKQSAIAPPLWDRLGLAIAVPAGLDTDALGTFTGEIPRPGTIRQTAIQKARLGMDLAASPLGLASEGSYGPHPQLPFIAAGVELLVLVDDERGITISEHLIDETPCYDQAVGRDAGALADFLRRIDFPRHALIIRPNQSTADGQPIAKGVRSHERLETAVMESVAASEDGMAFVQTDMRAHMNPTRMATLQRLAERLADRLGCCCPACRTPGYGVTTVEKGLPCIDCGGPSTLVRYQIFGCALCDYTEKRPRSDGLEYSEPAQCLYCNP